MDSRGKKKQNLQITSENEIDIIIEMISSQSLWFSSDLLILISATHQRFQPQKKIEIDKYPLKLYS